MRILAIDTALDACSAAVIDTVGDRVLASESREIGRGHAELLLPIVDGVMKAAAIKFDAIDRFAVTVGPGSFTGLRVGLSAARGFALVSKKPVVGISTLAAFTAPLITQDQAVPVVAAVDAKHGNLYMQMVGAGGRTLVTARAASLRETVRAVALGPVRIVGTGAAILAAHWPAKAPAPVLVDQRVAPDIIWIARIGAAADPDASAAAPALSEIARRGAASRGACRAAMSGFFAKLFQRTPPAISAARASDARVLANFMRARFRSAGARRNSSACCPIPPSSRMSRGKMAGAAKPPDS